MAELVATPIHSLGLACRMYVYTDIHTDIQTYMYIYIYTCVCAHVYIYIYKYRVCVKVQAL